MMQQRYIITPISPREVLLSLYHTPQQDRSQRACELCDTPTPKIADLFAEAGLLALGTITIKSKVHVLYQTKTGQLGLAEV